MAKNDLAEGVVSVTGGYDDICDYPSGIFPMVFSFLYGSVIAKKGVFMSNLAEKIESLPVPVRIEIEDFVDFVASRRSSVGGIPRHLIDPVHGSFAINRDWLDKAISEGRE